MPAAEQCVCSNADCRGRLRKTFMILLQTRSYYGADLTWIIHDDAFPNAWFGFNIPNKLSRGYNADLNVYILWKAFYRNRFPGGKIAMKIFAIHFIHGGKQRHIA